MDLGLTDKTALVTGSTAGIGLAAARGLAETGRYPSRVYAARKDLNPETAP